MGKMILGLILLSGIAWFVASDGGSKETCAHAESALVSNLIGSQGEIFGKLGAAGLSMSSAFLGGKLGDGRLMRMEAKERFPYLPSEAGCTVLFWDQFLRSL